MKIVFVIESFTHSHIYSDYIKKLFELKKDELFIILVKQELLIKEDEFKKYGKVIRAFDFKEKSGHTNDGYKKPKKRSFYFYWIYFLYLFWKHRKIKKRSSSIIEEIKPDLAIISSERYTEFDLFFAKCCQKRKIEVVVLGVNIFYVDSFDIYLRSDPKREITSFSKKLTAVLLPRQVFIVNDKRCLFYPPHLIWNLFLMNALPTRPYLTGSRFVDQIHVDCELTKQRYMEFGVRPELIRVVGTLEHDFIYTSLTQKEELKGLFKINPNEKIVILAVPQGYEHNLVTKEEHWEVIENVIKGILQNPVNLILSLHPKMNLQEYLFLEEKYNVQISKLPLREIIVISDLFVATFSMTVMWAMYLSIPCVIFDLYNLNYSYYKNAQTVTITKGLKDFVDTLQVVINDLNTKPERQTNSIEYGAFDRFVQNIHKLEIKNRTLMKPIETQKGI